MDHAKHLGLTGGPWSETPGALGDRARFFDAQWRKHGDVFRIQVAGFSGVVLAHPDHLQRILVSHRRNYFKGKIYGAARRVLGDGMLTLDGSTWKERRTLAQPAFHRASLEKLAAIMVESGVGYLARLTSQVVPEA